MSGFRISVQPAKPASSIRLLCEQQRKVSVHNSTRNCDYHILLIMTGNAHKESCHKLSLILVREEGLIKTDGSGKMVVAFTIKNNYLMVSLFRQLVLPFSYLYLWY